MDQLRALRWYIVVLFCSMLLLTGFDVWFTATEVHHQDVRSTQQVQTFCALFTTLDASFTAQPPTTASGKLFRSEVHAIVAQLHCPH